jgi:ppGpp synthetase/RelA/SpoT-type nucleotidyltranferase
LALKRDFASEYKTIRPVYEEFTQKLRVLLEELLTDEGIDYHHPIGSRTKSVESFCEKITRPDKSYREPLQEVTDLSGVRVIVYYLDDVPKIADVIERELAVDRRNSIDKRDAMRPDQFGYVSLQYVVSLTPDRHRLPEWKSFRGVKGEIQIRTLPQHVWAEIDRKLRYKREKDVPPYLLRRLYRIAGVLELVDEEFQTIRDQTARLENYPRTPISEGSLMHYSRNSPAVSLMEHEAYSCGFVREDTDASGTVELASACGRAGMKNLIDLERFLSSTNQYTRFLKELVKEVGRGRWKVSPTSLILILIYSRFRREFPKSYLRRRGWNYETIDLIRKVALRARW